MADCKSVAFGLNKFESYHSHKGESPVGRGNCLENSQPFWSGGSIPSLSADDGSTVVQEGESSTGRFGDKKR